MDSRFKPPKLFFKYLKSEYSYMRYRSSSIKLSNELQNGLLCAAYGATAWLRTKRGARWCFTICGIEEAEPHHAFNYYYVPPHGEKRRIDETHSITIFRRVKEKPAETLKTAVDIAKKVVYTEGWELPPEDMIKAALSAYREWIQKEDGHMWIKSVFRPIMEVSVHNGLAYKIGPHMGVDSGNNDTFWLGQDHVVTKPKQSLTCINCDMSYPCTTNLKGIGDLCNRCYGENFGEIDVLTLCNRHECAWIACENYMSDGKLEDVMFGKYGMIE